MGDDGGEIGGWSVRLRGSVRIDRGLKYCGTGFNGYRQAAFFPTLLTTAAVARANAQKLKVGAKVKRSFAHQKARMGLFVRTIGIVGAMATIALVNMAYNVQRWRWLNARQATL